MSPESLYDRIGRGYETTRQEDPRFAARIHAALTDARSVVNVGAGTGHYEPRDRDVVAVEPSPTMRMQRPAGAAPVVDAVAERLPFSDDSFDAAMAVLTDHHWTDRERGLLEMRRVARDRVVLFTWDPATVADSWLVRDYLDAFARTVPPGYCLDDVIRALGGARVEAVPIPHDCRDGFLHAYWRRPEAYLDPAVRDGISFFRLLEEPDYADGLRRLRDDLESERWRERQAGLLELEELDLGYRLVVAECWASRAIEA